MSFSSARKEPEEGDESLPPATLIVIGAGQRGKVRR
jgi:hypothetical protein